MNNDFMRHLQRLGIFLRNGEIPWFSTYKYLLRHMQGRQTGGWGGGLNPP